jgi:hypothetical protein
MQILGSRKTSLVDMDEKIQSAMLLKIRLKIERIQEDVLET